MVRYITDDRNDLSSRLLSDKRQTQWVCWFSGLGPVLHEQDAQKVLAGLKVGRGISKDLSDTVKAADVNLSQRLKVAERENAAVYLQVCTSSLKLCSHPGVHLGPCGQLSPRRLLLYNLP
jgi:ribosomal protein L28